MGNTFSGAYQKATLPVKLMTTFLAHFKFNTMSLDMIPLAFHLLKQDGFSTAVDFKITKDHIKKLLKSKNISLQVIIRIDNFFKKYDVKDGSIAFEKDIRKLLDIVISFFKNDKTVTDEENSPIGACENIVIKEDESKIDKLVLIKKLFTDLKPDEIHNIVRNIIYILHQMLLKPEEYGLECPDSKSDQGDEVLQQQASDDVENPVKLVPKVEQNAVIQLPRESIRRDINIPKTRSNKGGQKRKQSKKRRTRRRLQ